MWVLTKEDATRSLLFCAEMINRLLQPRTEATPCHLPEENKEKYKAEVARLRFLVACMAEEPEEVARPLLEDYYAQARKAYPADTTVDAAARLVQKEQTTGAKKYIVRHLRRYWYVERTEDGMYHCSGYKGKTMSAVMQQQVFGQGLCYDTSKKALRDHPDAELVL